MSVHLPLHCTPYRHYRSPPYDFKNILYTYEVFFKYNVVLTQRRMFLVVVYLITYEYE